MAQSEHKIHQGSTSHLLSTPAKTERSTLSAVTLPSDHNNGVLEHGATPTTTKPIPGTDASIKSSIRGAIACQIEISIDSPKTVCTLPSVQAYLAFDQSSQATHICLIIPPHQSVSPTPNELKVSQDHLSDQNRVSTTQKDIVYAFKVPPHAKPYASNFGSNFSLRTSLASFAFKEFESIKMEQENLLPLLSLRESLVKLKAWNATGNVKGQMPPVQMPDLHPDTVILTPKSLTELIQMTLLHQQQHSMSLPKTPNPLRNYENMTSPNPLSSISVRHGNSLADRYIKTPLSDKENQESHFMINKLLAGKFKTVHWGAHATPYPKRQRVERSPPSFTSPSFTSPSKFGELISMTPNHRSSTPTWNRYASNISPAQPSSVWKSPSVALISKDTTGGIQNLGSTCYIAAVLQLLFSSSICSIIKKLPIESCGSQPVLVEFRNLIHQRENMAQNLSISRIAHLILKHDAQKGRAQFTKGRQEDAHELLLALLEILEDECARLGDGSKLKSLIRDQFDWEIVHEVRCKECTGFSSKSTAYFRYLPLTLNSNPQGTDVATGLNSFFKSEDVEYCCPKCQHTQCTLSHSIKRVPHCMLLQVNRFGFRESETSVGSYCKVEDKLNISSSLDISSMLNDEKQGASFGLVSILSHIGSTMASGHYLADVKGERSSWTLYNDSVVRVEKNYSLSTRSKSCYILLYKASAT